jgi:hypothetical protein
MASTTVEEAGRCPRCEFPGEKVSENPAPNMKPGTKVIMFTCRTEGCRWKDTSWPVQVNPDGSVPIIDHSKTAKGYPNLMTTPEEERLVKSIEKQLAQETAPGGGEVRRPGQ